MHDDRIDEGERGGRLHPGAFDQGIDVVTRRDLVDRSEDPAQLVVAALEVRGQSIVAVGESCELVVARDPDRRGQVAGRDAFHGGRHGSQGCGQLVRKHVRRQHREREDDDDGEQQQTAHGRIRRGTAEHRAEDQHDHPEPSQWHDRGEDQGQGQARAKAQPWRRIRARFRGSVVVLDHGSPVTRSTDATSR